MVVGQTGHLGIVHNCVVKIQQRLELVIILHHLVGETIALVNQKKLWSVITLVQVCMQ